MEGASIKLLGAPEYTAEERKALIDFVLDLRKSSIQEFLASAELPKSGSKSDLRDRIQEALDDGHLKYEQLVDLLDTAAPWGKQHVLLYTGPHNNLQLWKEPDQFRGHLNQHRLGKLFNARLPLILPEKLTLSSITHADGKLRVTAVQRREYTERSPEHDKLTETVASEKITFKAYTHHLSRTLVAFEWDLNANTAMLQITQLHGDTLYENVAEEFAGLVGNWLDIRLFSAVDLRPIIRRLHELEGNGHAEARSHGIQYRSLQGRRVSAHSPSARDSVLGEAVIDDAMDSIGKNGVGDLGNFYWLAATNGSHISNPLMGDVHMIIVGDKSRINFPAPNAEEVVRYVLRRVRALS